MPTGTVEFYDGTTDLGPGSALSGSGNTATSTFTTAALSAATHEITAIYSPTGDFMNGSGFVDQTVNKAPLTVTAVLSTSDIGHGDTVPRRPPASLALSTATPRPSCLAPSHLPACRRPSALPGFTPSPRSRARSRPPTTTSPTSSPPRSTSTPWSPKSWSSGGRRAMSILNLNRDLPFFDITGLEVTYSDPGQHIRHRVDAHEHRGWTHVCPGQGRLGPGRYLETWNLPTAIGIDRLMLALDQANTVAANAPSLKLFGLTSQAFSVLPGDFNGDGVVSSADMTDVEQLRPGPYDIWADLNGDGTVDINDVKLAQQDRNLASAAELGFSHESCQQRVDSLRQRLGRG